MKKFLATAVAISLTTCAFAGQYVSGNFGTNYAKLTNQSNSGQKVGYKTGVCYGWAFDSNVRTELELSYRENHHRTKYVETEEDVISSKTYHSNYSLSLMANSMYDVKQLTYFSIYPYVGFGVGYCQNTEHKKIKTDTATNSEKEHDGRFAYQAIVGAKYPITENFDVGLEYKYLCGRDHGKDHSFGLILTRNF